MSIGTLILILEVLGVLGVATLVFITGHRFGRRSRRFDYPDGWDSGEDAERQRWEAATGTTLDQFTAWHRPPEPGLDGGWQEPPATEVLLKEAARQGYTEPVPSVADLDAMVADYEARAGADSHVRTGASAQGRPGAHVWDLAPVASPAPPIVADLTGAAAWHYPDDDVPTIAGVVVGQPPAPPPADWDLLAGSVLPDYAAAALGGHRTVDECVDSIVMRAVNR